MKYAQPIQAAIDEFSRLPGIGEKTAARLVFHLLRRPPEQVKALSRNLEALVERVRLCSVCYNLTEEDPCGLCADPRRSRAIICVVEDPPDLYALEKAGGLECSYHVLHGALNPIEGVGPEEIKAAELVERVRQGGVEEVILATNPNLQGETTSLYLAKILKPLGVKVTRLAHGLPMGGDLEYVDVGTIGRALEGRREM